MKIPLTIDNFLGGKRLVLYSWIEIPKFSTAVPIRAIIDTGSPHTIIMEKDLKKTRIRLSKLKDANISTNLGGRIPIKLFKLGKAYLRLKDEKFKRHKNSLPPSAS